MRLRPGSDGIRRGIPGKRSQSEKTTAPKPIVGQIKIKNPFHEAPVGRRFDAGLKLLRSAIPAPSALRLQVAGNAEITRSARRQFCCCDPAVEQFRRRLSERAWAPFGGFAVASEAGFWSLVAALGSDHLAQRGVATSSRRCFASAELAINSSASDADCPAGAGAQRIGRIGENGMRRIMPPAALRARLLIELARDPGKIRRPWTRFGRRGDCFSST